MFPSHNPAQNTFNWLCRRNNIPESNYAGAAVGMQEHVKHIRMLYREPIGRVIPYEDAYFRAAYLLAYFPYYIEPLCHVLEGADLPDSLFASGTLKAAFFGGGPCPEVLGLATYLKQRAPQLCRVDATIFDRQPGWNAIHQELVPAMLPEYSSDLTTYSMNSKQCDVVECLASNCNCGIADRDIIIGQNFLTEVYMNRARAIETFERLIRHSSCRYLVFIENHYLEVRNLMNELSVKLYDKGLTTSHRPAMYREIVPNFQLPQIMLQHLFIGSNGLIARKTVKFHHMVLEIAR